MNQIENTTTAEQAAYWIARLSSDQQTAGDRKRFSDWIEVDQDNGDAFDRILDTWQKCSYLDANTSASPSKSNHPMLAWPVALAASVICFIAVSLFFFNPPSSDINAAQYATAIGEFKSVTLQDGSVIELNTNSRVSVAYTENERNIELLNGEAYFQVAKNKQAPFVVTTRDAHVTALGTAFNIHSSLKSSQITVTEGVVSVEETSSSQALEGNRAIVKAGHSINVDKKTGIEVIKATLAQENTVSWRKRTLIFENIPLNTALEKLNRYLKSPIDISHHSLSTARVSGTFSLNQPEATLSALVESFKLKSETKASETGAVAYYIAK